MSGTSSRAGQAPTGEEIEALLRQTPGRNEKPSSHKMSNKIASLNVKLSGAANYPEWVTSLKLYPRITEVNEEYDAWDIIMGDYIKPTGAAKK